MRKLLKTYGLTSDMGYFEMIVQSVINGQHKQAEDQFKAMPKANRKDFLKGIFGYWESGLSQEQKLKFIQYI